MKDNKNDIYVVNLKKKYMLLNLDSLESKFILKKDIASQTDKLLHGNDINYSYVERYEPLIHEKVINPTIITSFKCNYSCDYCFEKRIERTSDVLKPFDIYRIMEFYDIFCKETSFPLKFCEFTIMGGEPLLPDNNRVLQSIADMWPNKLLKITTNGTYLKEYMEYIVRNNVQVKVSLEGTKDIHYKRRKTQKNDAYEKTIEGIGLLVKNKVPTTVLTVFSPQNIDDYPYFFDLLEKIGWVTNPKLTVGFIPEVGIGSDDMTIEQIMSSIEAYRKLKDMDKRTQYVDARRLFPGSINLMKALSYAKQGKYIPYRCSCLERPDYAFFPDGTVHLCTAISSDIGCIGRYKPLVEIDFKRIELFRKRRVDTLIKCRECSMKALCLGGCVATLLAKNNNILDTYCGFWEKPIFLETFEELF